jgi:hypothetical protein
MIEKFRWFALLSNAIMWSVVATTGANLVAAKRRSHNREKLINECLSRHHLAYTTFYLTLLITIAIEPNLQLLLLTLVGSAIFFFMIGLAFTREPDEKLVRAGHSCNSADQCTLRLGFRPMFRLLRGNVALTVVAITLAIMVILSPMVPAGPPLQPSKPSAPNPRASSPTSSP